MKKQGKNQNQLFERLIRRICDLHEITTKRMFGYESFFTNGRCFAGVRNLGKIASVVLKLSPNDYSGAIKESLFSPFRNTKDWIEFKVTSPKDVEPLIPWIELSFSYARNGEKNVGAIHELP